MQRSDHIATAKRYRKFASGWYEALVPEGAVWYGAGNSRRVMQTTFNDRWRRHDGFGLLAVAVIVAAAIAVGYLAGIR